MDLQNVKNELKEMYPEMQGFIQHTLVAEMCLKWHEKQGISKRDLCKTCQDYWLGHEEEKKDKRYCISCKDAC